MRTFSLLLLGLSLLGCRTPATREADAAVYVDANDGDVADDASDAADASDASDTADAEVTDAGQACAREGEAGTRTFALTSLALTTHPHPRVGFDVDGLNTTSAADIAGCKQIDLPGGPENALAYLEKSLAPTLAKVGVDIDQGFEEAIADGVIDLEIVLSDWNMAASDPCVVVTLQGTSSGTPVVPLVGRASLVGGFIDLVRFDAKITLTPSYDFKSDGSLGACTNDCVTVPLPFPLQDVTARILLSPDLTSIVATGMPNPESSSLLGGYMRYVGTDAEAFRNGFIPPIEVLQPVLASILDGVAYELLDLDSTPELTECTVTEGVLSADSLSAAFLMTASSR